MKRSTLVWALVAALSLSVVVAILLTPLGFESRPPSALTTLGIIAIVTVFVGIVTDVAAIIFLFRKVGLASRLAIAASVLFVFPIVVDRTGAFFTLPIPPMVLTLEYVFMVVLVVTLGLGWALYRVSDPSRS